jgi:hypothetical protein
VKPFVNNSEIKKFLEKTLEKSKTPVEERRLPFPLAAAASESSSALPPHPPWSSPRSPPLPPWTSLWPAGSCSLGTRARRAGREQLMRDPVELARAGQEQLARGPTELVAPPGSSSPGPETNFPMERNHLRAQQSRSTELTPASPESSLARRYLPGACHTAQAGPLVLFFNIAAGP